MKKENKQLAQKKRAQMKKRQAVKRVIVNVLKIAIPTILLLTVIALAIVNPFAPKNEDVNDMENAMNQANADEANTTMNLSTDSSLEVINGSTVNIDYVGKIDGVAFEGGSAQGANLNIGSGQFIDDFEQQLIGAHPGDTVEVNVTFPEDYHQEEFQGKDAVFEVVVNGIYE